MCLPVRDALTLFPDCPMMTTMMVMLSRESEGEGRGQREPHGWEWGQVI